MEDDSPELPLRRRVPGATRAAPQAAARPVLSEALLQRMRQAVEAARAEQAESPQDQVTQPLQRLSAFADPAVKDAGAGGATGRQGQPSRGARGPAPDLAKPDKPDLAKPDLASARPKSAQPEQAPAADARPAGPLGRARAADAPTQPVPALRPGGTEPPAAAGSRPSGPPMSPARAGAAPAAPPARAVPPAGAAHPQKRNGAVPAGVASPRSAQPRAGTRQASRRPRFGIVSVAALGVVAVAAASVAIVLSRHPAPAAPPPNAALERHEAISRGLAAAWIAQQVSRSATVACDQAMCAVLARHGFPARNLRVLGPTTPYPTTSTLVVETAAVRSIFGTSFSTNWAPAVLATFGTGNAEIAIRLIAPRGTASYAAAVGASLRATRSAAAQLLGRRSQVSASPLATRQLTSGQVDARLLILIAALATAEPVDLVAFGNVAAGYASPGVPLRLAYLSENGRAAHLSDSAYLRALVRALRAVSAQFRPAGAQTVTLPGGQVVLRIAFDAPSPLGLLGSQGSR
jgi:hypothetical protein